MKKNKALLTLGSETFVGLQARKLMEKGCRDVLISGEPTLEAALCGLEFGAPEAEEYMWRAQCDDLAGWTTDHVRIISDVYPDRGPLGGLHACLEAAQHSHCLVLSVDAPLIPVKLLEKLLEQHLKSGAEVTVLEHGGKREPLIAVYAAGLASRIEKLIRERSAPVRALMELSCCESFAYEGAEQLLMNCNEPMDYCVAQELYGQLIHAEKENIDTTPS